MRGPRSCSWPSHDGAVPAADSCMIRHWVTAGSFSERWHQFDRREAGVFWVQSHYGVRTLRRQLSSQPHISRLALSPSLAVASWRKRLSAMCRSSAKFSAACPHRTRLSSSRKAMSSTQCTWFSIPQWLQIYLSDLKESLLSSPNGLKECILDSFWCQFWCQARRNKRIGMLQSPKNTDSMGIFEGDPPGTRTRNQWIKRWSGYLCTRYRRVQKARTYRRYVVHGVHRVVATILHSILQCVLQANLVIRRSSHDPCSLLAPVVHSSVTLALIKYLYIGPIEIHRDKRDSRDISHNRAENRLSKNGIGQFQKRDIGIFPIPAYSLAFLRCDYCAYGAFCLDFYETVLDTCCINPPARGFIALPEGFCMSGSSEQPQETPKAASAFADYVALGPRRSLQRLAELDVSQGYAKSIPTRLTVLKRWSTEHKWQERIAEAVLSSPVRCFVLHWVLTYLRIYVYSLQQVEIRVDARAAGFEQKCSAGGLLVFQKGCIS